MEGWIPKTAPPHTLDANSKPQITLPMLLIQGLQAGVLATFSLGSINFFQWITELRETLIYVYGLTVKDITKDANEKMCRVGFGKPCL